ncbi:MAG: hypothetical protein K8R59_18560 [Thermoanaerobaculales bacterium]|nr:hypothetical protein [Thermoanaerobaculales bacterium]
MPITESYEYGAVGGAISEKKTVMPMPFPNMTRITQEFVWDDLGNLLDQSYPILEVLVPPSSTVIQRCPRVSVMLAERAPVVGSEVSREERLFFELFADLKPLERAARQAGHLPPQ